MLKVSIALLVVGLVYQASAAPSTKTIIISMADGRTTQKVLRELNTRSFSSLDQKRVAVGDALQAQADASQKDLLAFLAREKSNSDDITQLWITNQVVVKNADAALIAKLSARKDVAGIEEDRHIPMAEPIQHNVTAFPGNQWGVKNLNAPDAWSQNINGRGIVIGTIDTGVRVTHEALKENHRAEYGWYDPYDRTTTPNDQGGHGTHTMGTIIGKGGIGVAPDAQWISCRGCTSVSCTVAALTGCGQFIACPTNPQGTNKDCTKAPALVSNSWGGGNGDTWYEDVIATWHAAQVIPLFSAGNSGPYCGSANSPGDSPNVIGVGSITEANTLSSFSSVGPTYVGNRIKPDISAPGSLVYSSYHTSDTAYNTLSGTSMACPHVAGLVALLLTERPNLTYAQVKAILEKGVLTTEPTGRNCGNINESNYPNHHVGHGRVNALKALDVARSL